MPSGVSRPSKKPHAAARDTIPQSHFVNRNSRTLIDKTHGHQQVSDKEQPEAGEENSIVAKNP